MSIVIYLVGAQESDTDTFFGLMPNPSRGRIPAEWA
jgi:hypothetical protein